MKFKSRLPASPTVPPLRAAATEAAAMDKENVPILSRILSQSAEGRVAPPPLLTLTQGGGAILTHSTDSGSSAIVTTIANGEHKGVRHPFTLSCFSEDVDSFVIADSYGSLFSLSLSDNQYKSLRQSTVPITAMEYMHSKSNQLAVAYSNGVVVIIDTVTKQIVTSLREASKNYVQIIRCHQTKAMMLLGYNDCSVAIWDLRTNTKTRSILYNENIIDIRFELNGDVMAVALENSGVILYRTADCILIGQTVLPATERKQKYVNYCSTFYPNNRTVTEARPNENNNKLSNVRFILSTENGFIHTFHTDVDYTNAALSSAPVVIGMTSVVELPVKMKMCVSMKSIGELRLEPRLAILSTEGHLLLADIEGAADIGGAWTVVADMDSDELFKAASVSTTTAKNDSISINPFAISSATSKRPVRTHESILACRNDFFVIVTNNDGNANLCDSEILVGTGTLCGSFLRSRMPYFKETFMRAQFFGGQKNDRSVNLRRARVLRSVEDDDEKDDSVKVLSKKDKFLKEEEAKKGKDKGKGPAAKKAEAPANKTRAEKRKEALNRSTGTGSVETEKTISFTKKMKDPLEKDSELLLAMNVFELAKYTPEEVRVTHKKLTAFLAANGEYPERFRPLIWRFMLRLPENTAQFGDLVRRGLHPSFEALFDKYPLGSRRVFTRLQNCCSQLAHWSPVFAQCQYLPSFVFPFVLIYGVDELALLETVMSIFMWFGLSWHATMPSPPVHIMDSIDGLLRIYDSRLHAHLRKIEASPGLCGWAMISSFFSEVLGRADWLKLVDYVVTHFSNNGVVLMIPVVIMMHIRGELMETDLPETIYNTCRRQRPVKIAALLTTLDSLLSGASSRHFTAVHPPNTGKSCREGLINSTRQHDLEVIEQIRDSMNSTYGQPIWPLPKGRYPCYDGLPVSVVDWQLREREFALAISNEVTRRDDVLHQLERKVELIDEEYRRWAAMAKTTDGEERAAMDAAMAKETLYYTEMQRIEEEISERKLDIIRAKEKAAKEQFLASKKIESDAFDVATKRERHLRDKADIQERIAKVRDAAAAAEVEADERVQALYANRARFEDMQETQRQLGLREEEVGRKTMEVARAMAEIGTQQPTPPQISEPVSRLVSQPDPQQARTEVEEEVVKKVNEEIQRRMRKLQLEKATAVTRTTTTTTTTTTKTASQPAAEGKSSKIAKAESALKSLLQASEKRESAGASPPPEQEDISMMKTVDRSAPPPRDESKESDKDVPLWAFDADFE